MFNRLRRALTVALTLPVVFVGLAINVILCFASCASPAAFGVLCNGGEWLDADGHPINAHGGGVLYHKGTYYWYGEHKSDFTTAAMVGITCYSSKDLRQWENNGVVLSVVDSDEADLERGSVMERPKVIYNEATKQFVMWFHLERKGQGYSAARTAVAVSESPCGPFRYLRSMRVNPNAWPVAMSDEQRADLMQLNAENYKKWWTPQWYAAIEKGLFLKRDLSTGQMARDMTLFKDDDGKAYHIYSSEENMTLHIAELSADYTTHTGKYVRVAPGGMNEAPTIFKYDGTYWMITSGCTGWNPNAARLFSAPSIWGPWTQHGNPCKGDKAEVTFGAQGTFVLPVQGRKGAFLFLADVWKPTRPSSSGYLWLPITFAPDGLPMIVKSMK